MRGDELPWASAARMIKLAMPAAALDCIRPSVTSPATAELTLELHQVELLSHHPLFSRLDEKDLETELRSEGLKLRTVAGIVQFFASQKEAFLRDIGNSIEGRDKRPVLMFDAIQDDRTCEFCRHLNGKCVRLDEHGYFISLLPPFALGCRTSVISLTEDQRLKLGSEDCTDVLLRTAVPQRCPCASWMESHYWR